MDSFCCETAWDSLCVEECSGQCGGCGPLNDGCVQQSSAGVPPNLLTCDGSIYGVTGHCYKGFSGSATYATARAACMDWGGDLATLHFPAERDFAAGLLGCNSWIGLTDQTAEGSFVWVDGTPTSFTAWSSGEPNDSGGEDCTELKTDGQWNDLPCGTTRCYVCERPMPPVTGCDGCACKDCVCSMDPYCCQTAWDSLCVGECQNDCGGCGFSGCTEAPDRKGCNGCPCQGCVCAMDAYCCETGWDSLCVNECLQDCGGCGPF
jgi:hypothetical protein